MTNRTVRTIGVLTLVAVGAAGWLWWSNPERQIRAILDDAAAALSAEPGEDSLDTLAAAAALQRHLAPDIVVTGPDGVPLIGRDTVVTAAARLRARQVRVRFFDPSITVNGDGASVRAIAEVTTRPTTGDGAVEVYDVEGILRWSDGRWLVATARASDDESAAARMARLEAAASRRGAVRRQRAGAQA